MTESSDKTIVAIAILIIAMILAGEVIVYTSDYTDYSADAQFSEGRLDYSISANGSKTYSVVAFSNGSYEGIDKLFIYYDPSYKSNYEDVKVAIGARALDQEYYVDQIIPTLRYRNIGDVTIVDADELEKILLEDISNTDARYGIVFLSGAFPETVYKGSSDDLIFQWMKSGGYLYWLGNLIGSCYATHNELIDVPDYQQLFFGTDCLNVDGPKKAYSEIDGYCSVLSMVNTDLKYSVNGSMLSEGTKHLELGFTEDGYSTASLVGFGAGMMCILSGDYSNNQRNDLAQIIASGIGPESTIIGVDTGTVTRGTATGAMECKGDNLSAYIYLGGYYPVFCKLFRE